MIGLAVVFRMTNEKTNLPPRITGESITKFQLRPEGRGCHVKGSPRIGFCGPIVESRGASGRETLATAGVEVSAEELTGFAVQFVTLAQMQNSKAGVLKAKPLSARLVSDWRWGNSEIRTDVAVRAEAIVVGCSPERRRHCVRLYTY